MYEYLIKENVLRKNKVKMQKEKNNKMKEIKKAKDLFKTLMFGIFTFLIMLIIFW